MPVRDWFSNLRTWFLQIKEAAPTELQALQPLPPSVGAVLTDQLEALPLPSIYQTRLAQVIAEAVQTWQANEDAANTLVILGSPVEPISQIVRAAAQQLCLEELQVIDLLPCSTRPEALNTITTDLQQGIHQHYPELANHDRDVLDSDQEDLVKRRKLLMIPDLSQCFLRSINGWRSIEFLRDTVIHDSSYFWLIGCNSWSWQFLDHVCQISAYLEQTQPLPTLEADVIEAWLDPVVQLVPDFRAQDRDEAESKKYWERLAKKSSGFSQTAAYLWLHSLRIREDKLEDLPQHQLQIKLPLSPKLEIQAVEPNLPSLPELKAIDLYLIHSILIHGNISRPHLALSFGEPESVIRDRVQILLRAGVIAQDKHLLKIHPIYYSKLRTELEHNNFLIGATI